MKGLDVTVLKLSEVRADNEKFRVDDGYFAKLPILTQQRIEALPHVRLGEVCSVFRKGIFDIKASSYAEIGVPFVRISNLRDGLIDSKDVARITREAHEAESNTALIFGDIVLSKTAYAAASFVNVSECNVSQDTIAVRLSPSGKKRLKSGFIVAYLNCRYGLALMGRQFQGNVQAHLSLPDGRKVPVPLFSDVLQTTTDKTLRDADAQLLAAEQKMAEAEAILTAALGLSGWQPPEPLTYTRRASEAFAAGRLDAQYFAPRVRELLTLLGAGGRTVRDAAPPRQEKFDPKAPRPPRAPNALPSWAPTAQPMPAQGNALGPAPTKAPAPTGRLNAAMNRPVGAESVSMPDPRALPWAGMEQAVGLPDPATVTRQTAGLAPHTFRDIEISDVQSDGTATDNTLPVSEAPSRATWHVRAGDVLTSTVRPNRRLSAIAMPEQDGCIASSGFAVLQPQAVPAEVLLTYLRLPLFCELMDLHTSASLYPAISERDLLALPFPEIPAKASAAIVAAVRAAHTARARARTLLATAQRAVEIAIEKDEATALTFLARG